ncbi:MAG: hypothetical protein LWX01_08080 [Deltaproteobacteria bacterium]|nr:hypothetical protein [Deltaproteobacteria bacterium]MDL1961642.1 hypothetical protein [Deltaproteobacteria bacterium]
MNLAYKVTGDQENIIISLSRESVDQKALEKLLDYLELESIRRRSQLTEPDAESLTSDVKQAAWQKVKGIF